MAGGPQTARRPVRLAKDLFLFAVDRQADHRRRERPRGRPGTGGGAILRFADGIRPGQVHDGLFAPWADRRARPELVAAAGGGTREWTGPAIFRSNRRCSGSFAHGSGEPGDASGEVHGIRPRICPGAGDHGFAATASGHETTSLRRIVAIVVAGHGHRGEGDVRQLRHRGLSGRSGPFSRKTATAVYGEIIMSDLVSLTKDGDIGIITVNNPPVNALSPGVPEAIQAFLEEIQKDTALKAAVLIGGGRTFIAGADIKEFGKITSGQTKRGITLNEILTAVENCSKPVICAIHGTAFGGGLETAMSCHYRVAVPS